MKKREFEGYEKKNLWWWVEKIFLLIISLIAFVAAYKYSFNLFK